MCECECVCFDLDERLQASFPRDTWALVFPGGCQHLPFINPCRAPQKHPVKLQCPCVCRLIYQDFINFQKILILVNFSFSLLLTVWSKRTLGLFPVPFRRGKPEVWMLKSIHHWGLPGLASQWVSRGKRLGMFFLKVPEVILMLQRIHALKPLLDTLYFKAVIYWYRVVQDKAEQFGGKWTPELGKLFSCLVFSQNPFPEVNGLGLKPQRSQDTIILSWKLDRLQDLKVLAFCGCPTHTP